VIKKVLIGISTLVYMTVVSGIALEIHYCMGKEAGREFYGSNDGPCGRCGMKEKKAGCCHDEHKFIKLEDSHKNVSNDLNFNGGSTYVEISYPEYRSPLLSELSVTPVNNHSPPADTGPSKQVLNCVFRL